MGTSGASDPGGGSLGGPGGRDGGGGRGVNAAPGPVGSNDPNAAGAPAGGFGPGGFDGYGGRSAAAGGRAIAGTAGLSAITPSDMSNSAAIDVAYEWGLIDPITYHVTRLAPSFMSGFIGNILGTTNLAQNALGMLGISGVKGLAKYGLSNLMEQELAKQARDKLEGKDHFGPNFAGSVFGGQGSPGGLESYANASLAAPQQGGTGTASQMGGMGPLAMGISPTDAVSSTISPMGLANIKTATPGEPQRRFRLSAYRG